LSQVRRIVLRFVESQCWLKSQTTRRSPAGCFGRTRFRTCWETPDYYSFSRAYERKSVKDKAPPCAALKGEAVRLRSAFTRRIAKIR
jgi:hypothetical protein